MRVVVPALSLVFLLIGVGAVAYLTHDLVSLVGWKMFGELMMQVFPLCLLMFGLSAGLGWWTGRKGAR